MKPKFASADFTFPLLPHDDVLKLVAMLGFEGIDIGLFEKRSHLWPSREFKNLTRSARRLKRKLEGAGLKAADIFLQMNTEFVPYAINHPQATRRRKARDWFSKTLEYASICGAKHVTVLPGANFDTEPYRDSFSRSIEELGWRVAQAKQHEIVFGFEAHVGSIVPKPKSAEKLVERVPGVTLTLDYTHFAQMGMPDSAVEPLLKYASHFHVRGARKGRLQTAFKDNVIDYRRIYQRLKALKYPGWIGIEYTWFDWEHCNECDNISETILYRDFFKSLVK